MRGKQAEGTRDCRARENVASLGSDDVVAMAKRGRYHNLSEGTNSAFALRNPLSRPCLSWVTERTRLRGSALRARAEPVAPME
jgi:hypothetical protein